MNIKMILTDLDHTLLRSDGSISEHTKQILKKCQDYGILITIATARNWIGAERYIDEIQPDYEITTDGTLIHQRGKQIYSCCMDINDANQIIQDLLEQNPNTEMTVASGRLVFGTVTTYRNPKNCIKQFLMITKSRYPARSIKY